MNKLITTILSTAIIAMTTNASQAQNPLMLDTWDTPHQAPPFSKILPEHYSEAVPTLIQQAEQEVLQIASLKQKPTFDNTIVALERVGAKLSRALGVFYNMLGSNTNQKLQDISMELSPILTKYSNDISLNEDLYKKVKTVYEAEKNNKNMSAEDAMLLEKTYKGFVRNGAELNNEEKNNYRRISAQLAKLSLRFDQNDLASTNEYFLNITDKNELKGLPEWAINAAELAAKDAHKEGYLITLHAPSYIPVATYADNRDLREKLWRAYYSKGLDPKSKYSNIEIVKQIVNLRLELAQLFGYKNYAEFALEMRMAENPKNVTKLLGDLLDASADKAKKDVAVIAQYAKENGFQEQLQSWDFGYWSEKYKEEKYAISDDMTRPYFKIENCQNALFMLANKLYGLTFKSADNIEGCHEDANTFEVFDYNGEFLSLLYLDFHPRASKNSGAWMNSYRDASIDAKGNEIKPIVTLVCNFTNPTEDTPALLSFNELVTMLHEFGHGLHGMFGKGKYGSINGTSVYRDFVELPSQLMENWALESEFLDLFAVHYKTGERIPQEIIDKLVAAKNYNAAYTNLRQISFGIADMAWHTITEPFEGNVEDFEKNAMAPCTLLPAQKGTCMATAFGHIFAGGYAAGYYSYKWAEVLEADAFNQFKKNGIFDETTAAKFRDLMQSGGTEKPMTLYVRFAGQEPSVQPLLEKMGLTK